MVQKRENHCKSTTTCQQHIRKPAKENGNRKQNGNANVEKQKVGKISVPRDKITKSREVEDKTESTEVSESGINKSIKDVVTVQSRDEEGKEDKKEMGGTSNENEVKDVEATKSSRNFKQNVKLRKLEEFMAKKKREEEERERFVKEMAEKKAEERAEIVKQARRLILYKKPLCREINRAMLVSECLRQLDEQVVVQKTMKQMEQEREKKYIDMMRADVQRYKEEEECQGRERLEKLKTYTEELKKQIMENEIANKTTAKETLEMEMQDHLKMSQYLQQAAEHEADEISKKKKKLQQFFKDAIEEKKQFEMKLKRDEEFEDRAIEIYKNAKARIEKMHKNLILKEKQEKEIRAETIQKHTQEIKGSFETRKYAEDEILRKAIEEQEAAEREKQKAKKEHENSLRMAVEEFQAESLAAKKKQIEDEKEFKAWEMMQRFKRDEYNREVEREEKQREMQNKLEYANILKQELEEKKHRDIKERILEEEATDMKRIIEKENQKILKYAEEVVEESKGKRPLYPILKAVEGCKKVMGLATAKQQAVAVRIKPRRRQSIKKPCNKYVSEEKLCYL